MLSNHLVHDLKEIHVTFHSTLQLTGDQDTEGGSSTPLWLRQGKTTPHMWPGTQPAPAIFLSPGPAQGSWAHGSLLQGSPPGHGSKLPLLSPQLTA